MNQTTIKKEVSLSGVGLHTGQKVNLKFKPADAGHGVKFQRIDLDGKPTVSAVVGSVSSTNRSTTIKSGEAQVTTVEHLLSALSGLGIDNVLVEIDGGEVPILDGSAKKFVAALKKAGIEEQDAEREYFEITEPISYKNEETGAEILAFPSEKFELTTLIDFNSKTLGNQYACFDATTDDFSKEIAPNRTFVFLRELEQLVDQNLIKGGDLDNAIVIADKVMSAKDLKALAKKLGKPSIQVEKAGILNLTELNFENEPARHKLLDLIGDISLLGMPIKGKIIATKPGHAANVEFTKILKQKLRAQRKLRGKPNYDPRVPPVLDTVQVQEILPHRHPFLMVDKIIEMGEKKVVGVKTIAFNEPWFTGHFPGNPVFPGVLQIEAMAQTGGILAITSQGGGKWDTYFVKIDNCKYRQKVVPGDTLIIKLELTAPIRRGMVVMKGTAYVGDKIVSEAELTAQIVKRPEE